MFKFMLLWPHQIMSKMNGLCVKIDLTEVAYFGNTRSKVRDLVCHLLSQGYIFFKKWLLLSICKYINSKIKKYFAKLQKYFAKFAKSLCS